MASRSADKFVHYFKKGAEVEISSNDAGFRGSWYAGTVIRPPGDTKKTPVKVLVEYKTLMENETKKNLLREEVDLVQLRPSLPLENGRSFKFSDEVDAYYSDGWWEGIITEVLQEDEFSVFFRGTREQISFKASQLRLHREWVYGKWVPPFETLPKTPSSNEKLPSSSRSKSKKGEADCFSNGDLIESHIDEEGFEDAWFAAKIVKRSKKDKYLVEYLEIRNDNNTGFLREEVDTHNIRPCPPFHEIVDPFEVGGKVDALYNDGWWSGVIRKVYKNGNYLVFFDRADEEMRFNHSELRIHHEWTDGKWQVSS